MSKKCGKFKVVQKVKKYGKIQIVKFLNFLCFSAIFIKMASQLTIYAFSIPFHNEVCLLLVTLVYAVVKFKVADQCCLSVQKKLSHFGKSLKHFESLQTSQFSLSLNTSMMHSNKEKKLWKMKNEAKVGMTDTFRGCTVFENSLKCRIFNFRILAFFGNFCLIKMTCLVTLFDRDFQFFKIDHFWHFYKLLSTHIVNVARFAHNIK